MSNLLLSNLLVSNLLLELGSFNLVLRFPVEAARKDIEHQQDEEYSAYPKFHYINGNLQIRIEHYRYHFS
jgi:hypothetical protein